MIFVKIFWFGKQKIRKTWKQICSCSAHSAWAALMVIAKNSSRCHFTTSCMLQGGHIGGWEVGWESFWREAGLAGKWHPMGWIIDNFKPTQIITLLTTRYLQYLLARKECSNIWEWILSWAHERQNKDTLCHIIIVSWVVLSCIDHVAPPEAP